MNSKYNDIIKSALEDYIGNTNNKYDNTRLKEFAEEAIKLINHCLNTFNIN